MSKKAVTFDLKNTNPLAKGKAILYITTEVANNQLQLTLTNTGENSLNLKGGEVLAERDVKAGGAAAIYLYLSGVFDGDKSRFGAVQVGSSGWVAKPFLVNGNASWGLSPVNNLSLAKGESIQIELDNIPVVPSSKVAFLTIDYYNLGDIQPGSYQFHVTVANLPDGRKKDLRNVLLPAWTGGGDAEVYISENGLNPFSNKLTFSLTNDSKDTPLVPEGVDWEKKPSFTLSFVYANPPGYGALSTPQRAKKIKLNALNLYNNDWGYAPDAQGEVPAWTLHPKDHQILGEGSSAMASVEFEFSDIVTYLQNGNTELYISWQHIPGYNGGSTSLPIQKLYPPSIQSFKADPPKVVLENPDDVASVKLSWEVSHDEVGQVNLDGLPINKNETTVKVNNQVETQEHVLSVAFGSRNRPFFVEKKLEIPVSFKAPEISLTSSLQHLNFFQQGTNTVNISWDVKYAKSVSFTPEGYIPGLQPPKSSIPLSLTSKNLVDVQVLDNIQMKGFALELIAEGYGKQEGKSKSLSLIDTAWEYIYMKALRTDVEELQKVFSNTSKITFDKLKPENEKLISDFHELSKNVRDLVVNNISLFVESARLQKEFLLEIKQDPNKAPQVVEQIKTALMKPIDDLIAQYERVIVSFKTIMKASMQNDGHIEVMTNSLEAANRSLAAEIAKATGSMKEALMKQQDLNDFLLNAFGILQKRYWTMIPNFQQQYNALLSEQGFWQAIKHNWSMVEGGNGIPPAQGLQIFFQILQKNLSDIYKNCISKHSVYSPQNS